MLSTRTGVVIYLYGLPNESTRALDAEYDAAFQEWISDRKAARERGESSPPRDPPTQPGTLLIYGARLGLTDDLGNGYESVGKTAGGTGTEWEFSWRFKPGIPEEASTVTVTFDANEGRSEPCTLRFEFSHPASPGARGRIKRGPRRGPGATRADFCFQETGHSRRGREQRSRPPRRPGRGSAVGAPSAAHGVDLRYCSTATSTRAPGSRQKQKRRDPRVQPG